LLKRKVPIWIALPTVLIIGATFYSVDNRKAEASLSSPAKVWSGEDCLKCHTDKKILLRMQDKRGDPTYCQAAFDQLFKLQDSSPKPKYGSK